MAKVGVGDNLVELLASYRRSPDRKPLGWTTLDAWLPLLKGPAGSYRDCFPNHDAHSDKFAPAHKAIDKSRPSLSLVPFSETSVLKFERPIEVFGQCSLCLFNLIDHTCMFCQRLWTYNWR